MIRDPGRGGTLAKVRGTMIFVLDLGISSVVISGPLGVGPRRTSADLGDPGLRTLRNYTRTRHAGEGRGVKAFFSEGGKEAPTPPRVEPLPQI